MELARNIEKTLEIALFDADTEEHVDIEAIEVVEFCFDQEQCRRKPLYKYYRKDGSGEVVYDDSRNSFLVPLKQEETKNWRNPRLPIQLRVRFDDGTVEPTKIKVYNVAPVLSNEVI